MAQTGQLTPSGGREWSLTRYMCALRPVTFATAQTLNYIGCWVRESTTANANDLVGAILTNTGALLHQTPVLTAPVSNTTFVPTAQQIPFASSVTVPAGTYLLAVACSADPEGTTGRIVLQGQNDAAGSPTWASNEENLLFWPTWVSDISTGIATDAPRQWDIFVDHSDAASGSGPTITSISDNSLNNGQTSVTITGTGFGASQGAGRVVIAGTNAINGTNAQNQTITAWSDTSITFTAVRGSNAWDTGCHLFVESNGGQSNSSGAAVSFVPRVFINETLENLAGAAPTATGIAAVVYRDLPTVAAPNPATGDVFEGISTTGALRIELQRGTLTDGAYVLLVVADSSPRAAGVRFVQVAYE